ncbi:hypothetical protein NA57DRAFT_60859 [Rhizodiscina lignyota]|uniref:Uncharacterized protein n=1 Tax=Rhizodiscina lignyota TaxID=1504668 RepID=A0A9P4M132_9PEZI|nr:hypothetical protein NA57DRAFT_60859 [Rhizodiscina lignyota]
MAEAMELEYYRPANIRAERLETIHEHPRAVHLFETAEDQPVNPFETIDERLEREEHVPKIPARSHKRPINAGYDCENLSTVAIPLNTIRDRDPSRDTDNASSPSRSRTHFVLEQIFVFSWLALFLFALTIVFLAATKTGTNDSLFWAFTHFFFNTFPIFMFLAATFFLSAKCSVRTSRPQQPELGEIIVYEFWDAVSPIWLLVSAIIGPTTNYPGTSMFGLDKWWTLAFFCIVCCFTACILSASMLWWVEKRRE